jgi:pterin-4a-carbinolamine dehydratase
MKKIQNHRTLSGKSNHTSCNPNYVSVYLSVSLQNDTKKIQRITRREAAAAADLSSKHTSKSNKRKGGVDGGEMGCR